MKVANKLRRLVCSEEDNLLEFSRKREQLAELSKHNKETRELVNKLCQTTSAGRKKAEDDFDRLQVELKELAFKLDTQSKKNTVLKELIDLTNRNLVQSKKESIGGSELAANIKEKQIRKEQYDIQQILQKHNEQVAKINVLREQVSFSRRERVVYSNLFKKIEKQIKVYEERFKEVLLHVFQTDRKTRELAADATANLKASERTAPNSNTRRLSNGSAQMRSQGKKFTHLVDFQLDCDKTVPEDQIFITNAAALGKSRENVAVRAKNTHKADSVNDELAKLQGFFNALRTHLKCSDCSVDQLIDEIDGVEDDNGRLVHQISIINELIAQCSDRFVEVKKSGNESEHMHRASKHSSSASHANSQSLEEEIKTESQRFDQDILTMKRLYQLLGGSVEDTVQPTAENSFEYFRVISGRVSQLNSLLTEDTTTGNRKLSKRLQLENNDTQIDTLIERLEHYTESEKVFTKEAFNEQSNKELMKLRKIRSRLLNSNR